MTSPESFPLMDLPSHPLEIEYTGGGFRGDVEVQGSKHAFAHTLAVACMADSGTIRGVPRIGDTAVLLEILAKVFSVVQLSADRVLYFAYPRDCDAVELDDDLVGRSRNVYCMLPSLLARAKKVFIRGKPAGCVFAHRPDEWYFDILRRYGVQVAKAGQSVELQWAERNVADIQFSYPTMSGSVIALAAAAGCVGDSYLRGISSEPSVMDLFDVLRQMSCGIGYAGRNARVRTRGRLAPADVVIRPDQEVSATLLCALALAGGEAVLVGSRSFEMRRFSPVAAALGIQFDEVGSRLRAEVLPRGVGGLRRELVAGAHPLLCSDWVPSIAVALCARARSTGTLTDTMFADRLRVLPMLANSGFPSPQLRIGQRWGRDAVSMDFCASDWGSYKGGIYPEPLDTRSSAAIIVSSIVARGRVVLESTYHLRRAYENLPGNLCALGNFSVSPGPARDEKRMP